MTPRQTVAGGRRRVIGLLVALLSVSCATISAADDESYWAPNSGLLVRLAACVGTAAGSLGDDPAPPAEGVPEVARPGEAFDSPDFQQMLLLLLDWNQAFVLDLPTAEVHAYPPAAIEGPNGEFVRPTEAGAVVGTFYTGADGCIEFTTPECRVTVEPAPPLVGVISREELEMRQPAYSRRTRSYSPDASSVQVLAEARGRIEVVAFFGTWCSTCKEHLPALLSTLDAAANPEVRLTLVGMDEDMAEPYDLIDEYGVGDVPTFVLLVDAIEIGRIAAEPVVSVETDLAEFLQYAR